jgi:hypothetical protein
MVFFQLHNRQKCEELNLVEGAVFKADGSNSPFDSIMGSVIKMENDLGFSHAHFVNRREKGNRLELMCALYQDVKCMFYIYANKGNRCNGKETEPDGHRKAVLKFCNPFHTCQNICNRDLLKGLYKDSNGNIAKFGRRNNYKSSTVAFADPTGAAVLQRPEPDPRKRKLSGKDYVDTMAINLPGVKQTLQQGRHHVRKTNKLSFLDEALELCKLPALFEHFRKADPEGIYILKLKKLSYEVNVPSDEIE